MNLKSMMTAVLATAAFSAVSFAAPVSVSSCSSSGGTTFGGTSSQVLTGASGSGTITCNGFGAANSQAVNFVVTVGYRVDPTLDLFVGNTGSVGFANTLGAIGYNQTGTATEGGLFVPNVTFNFADAAAFNASAFVNNLIFNISNTSLSGAATGATHTMRITVTYDDGLQAVIPEPSTYALLGAGLAGLAFLRRRK